MRTLLAITAARFLAVAARLRGGGATSLPGLAALQLDPGLIRKLSRRLGGNIVVTGTNGKTTTSQFIGNALERAGRPVVRNRSGSNLLRGIASTLALELRRSSRGSGGRKAWGVFEVDEATMPTACRELRPKVVVVTNLFRDQLDRYGELKQTAELLRAGLRTLPKSSVVVLNADDPLVASLGKGLPQTVRYFGIEDTSRSKPRLPHAADSVSDPKTGALLAYSAVFVGHLGHYRGETLRRPRPQVRLTDLAGSGHDTTLTIALGRQRLAVPLRVPGLYNAYNALAALAATDAAGISGETAARAVGETAAVFGRQEAVDVEGRRVLISLIKNPTGANEVIHTLAEDRSKKHFLILINDNFADGLDVSWLWDTDFDRLRPQAKTVAVGGLRGTDMALRLKYAGFDPAEIARHVSVPEALRSELSRLKPDETLHVLPTYTAMLALRRELTRAGHVKHYLS